MFKNGDKSLELTSTAGNTTLTCDKTYTSLDLSDLETFSLLVSTDDPTGFANYLTAYISHDNWANYYQFSKPATYYLKAGEWYLYTIRKEDFTVGAGTPNWDNAFTKVRFTIKSATGKTPKLILGGMYKNIVGIPRVLFMADDAHQSVYTKMYKYLVDEKEKCFTFNFATNFMDTETNCTFNMSKEMYDTGKVDFANHTATHEDLTTLTLKAARDSIINGKKALDEWGFTRASDFLAFPFGSFNADIINICKTYGIKAARVVGNMMNQYVPVDDLLKLKCVQIINTTTVDEACAFADDAMKYGQTCIYLFHQLSDTYNAGNTSVYEFEKFKKIVDHCIEIGIPFTTISKWYYGLQNANISD
jgi:peptidoglycan/xylan/chitin deacetylase (PgdA/CDA1 family)